jgi:hypothetical protein
LVGSEVTNGAGPSWDRVAALAALAAVESTSTRVSAAEVAASFGSTSCDSLSEVTSSGPSSNSPVMICAGGAGAADVTVMKGSGTTGCSAVPASSPGDAVIGGFFSIAATVSAVSAGREPVSPARRRANVSSFSAGTSMVCGTRRGAEMRSIDTMM